MKQQIRQYINHKIFGKKNIIDLAEYIVTLNTNNNFDNIDFSICFSDDSMISSTNLEIFNNRLFDEKEIKYIDMTYKCYNLQNFLSIHLHNYDTAEISRIELESKNEEWFFTVKGKIEQLLSYCDNKSIISNLLLNHATFLHILIGSLASISSFFIIRFLNKFNNWNYQTIFTLFFILSIPISTVYLTLLSKLEKAYPSIEISINDKNNMANKRRRTLILLFTYIIIPLIPSILYDIIKMIVSKS